MRWCDLTIEQAAAQLAAIAVSGHQKRAGFSDFLTGIGGTLSKYPELRHALLGGGLGALAGGGATMLHNMGRDEDEKKSPLGGALTGGLAGAALGGGISAAVNRWPTTKPEVAKIEGALNQTNDTPPVTSAIRQGAGVLGDVARTAPFTTGTLAASGIASGAQAGRQAWQLRPDWMHGMRQRGEDLRSGIQAALAKEPFKHSPWLQTVGAPGSLADFSQMARETLRGSTASPIPNTPSSVELRGFMNAGANSRMEALTKSLKGLREARAGVGRVGRLSLLGIPILADVLLNQVRSSNSSDAINRAMQEYSRR